ncbi:hypothetical protein [Streptomyces sp. NPDC049949]|uniref:hypothetical protein n=1 Tax=Streptomyces sp. NPDC049949 TaxID=3154627 RepID=UPI003415CC98
MEPAERAALDQGVAVRRGQGYTLHVTAATAAHRQLLAQCQPLDGGPGLSAVPAQRKARRGYESRAGGEGDGLRAAAVRPYRHDKQVPAVPGAAPGS